MNYKVCEGCGANLDPGEICEDCLGFTSFKQLYSALEKINSEPDYTEAEIDDIIRDISAK